MFLSMLQASLYAQTRTENMYFQLHRVLDLRISFISAESCNFSNFKGINLQYKGCSIHRNTRTILGSY